MRVIGQTRHDEKGGRPSQRGSTSKEENKNALCLVLQYGQRGEEDEEDERRMEERPDLKLFL